MSGFAADWLALREPYDRRARSAELAQRFAEALGPAPRLTDLGCGTGANLRYLAPMLAPGQQWLCVDHDRTLLALAENAHGCARFGEHDIASGLEGLTLEETGVTASALLDLTSARWLEELAARCQGSSLLFALNFDGRLAWQPPLAEDAMVDGRFAAHQRTDKGFGPALGPEAAAHLATLLDDRGHRVTTVTSDWHLNPDDSQMLAAMVEGVVAAASAIEDDRRLAQWAGLRRAQRARNELGLTVGHVDLLALPEAA